MIRNVLQSSRSWRRYTLRVCVELGLLFFGSTFQPSNDGKGCNVAATSAFKRYYCDA